MDGPSIREQLTTIAVVLDSLVEQVADLRAQGGELERAGICTGVVYWRKDNGTPKLYVNHPKSKSCPVHGDPPANGRLRVYVGLGREEQERAMAAITRRRQKAELETQIAHLEAQRRLIEQAITAAWYAARENRE